MDATVLTKMLCEALVICLITWYVMFHIRRRRLYKLAGEFSGPRPLPIIGNALQCMMPLTEMAQAILKGSLKYKSPSRLWFGPYLVVHIWNPADIKVIVNSQHALGKQPYLYKLLELILGRSIVVVPVEEWKRRRRLMNPNFNQSNLDSYFEIFCRHSKLLVDKLKNEEGKGFFEVEDYLARSTLDMSLESLLGIKQSISSSNGNMDIMELFKIILSGITTRISNIMYLSDFIFKMSSAGKRFTKSLKQFEMITNSIIEKWTQSTLRKHVDDNENTFDSGLSTSKNFIEHLLSTYDEKGALTSKELKAEANTIIVAGLETTASIMGYLLIVLGMHPEIQERVYQEITNVLGTKQQLQPGDLQELTYTERVIKETLRIFPVIGGVGRFNEREIKLENQTIPAGSNIIIGLLSLHRDPNIWPNPTKFDPDRFLPEEESKRHPYSWIPFSAGPRNCIGLRFALMTLRIMTVQMVSNYIINTPYKNIEDVQLKMLILLKPMNGYTIGLSRRKRLEKL